MLNEAPADLSEKAQTECSDQSTNTVGEGQCIVLLDSHPIPKKACPKETNRQTNLVYHIPTKKRIAKDEPVWKQSDFLNSADYAVDQLATIYGGDEKEYNYEFSIENEKANQGFKSLVDASGVFEEQQPKAVSEIKYRIKRSRRNSEQVYLE